MGLNESQAEISLLKEGYCNMKKRSPNIFYKRKARLHRAYKRYKSTGDLDWAYDCVKKDMTKEKMVELLQKYYNC